MVEGERSKRTTRVRRLGIDFGVRILSCRFAEPGAASLATAFFIPDRFHSSEPEMIHGIHREFLALGVLTVFSTLIFSGLKSEDGDSVKSARHLAARAVSRSEPVCDRQRRNAPTPPIAKPESRVAEQCNQNNDRDGYTEHQQ
jgi:hypothetical protein